MDVVFGVENYSESENLILKDYDKLKIKDKIYYLTNIKFVKQSINKENDNGSGDDINLGNGNEKPNILNDENLDENLNNSDEEDDLLLADNKNNITMDLFDISYEIYIEKRTKNKKRKYYDITNSDCDLISKI